MNKLFINKISGSLIDTHQQKINYTDLNIDYTEKIDNSISELKSNDTILFFEKNENETNENLINNFLVDYDNIKLIMTEEQLIDFYETIQSDLPPKYLQGNLIKNNVLDIKHSQGVLITNKNNKINKRQLVFTDNTNFNDPHTFTTWIKPNSKNFSRKTLIRNQLTFSIKESDIV